MKRTMQQAETSTRSAGGGRKIVLTTFGSLGDLHPYMALALGLQARGHRAVIATSEVYRQKVEAEGIGFHSLRPDVSHLVDDPETFQKVMHARTGTEHILRQIVMPTLRETYDDLMQAVRDADLLVTHPLSLVGPIIVEKTSVRWVSTVLSPMSLLSAYDVPIYPNAPGLSKIGRIGPPVAKAMLRYGRRLVAPWSEPVYRLRAELGLPRGRDPLLEGQHSPECVLALFSEVLASPQPDWPPQTRQPGFLFYDRQEKGRGTPPELAQFLNSGPPPFIFTLGSAAVHTAGDFYKVSAAAARRLNRRAVLLTGPARVALPEPLPQGVVAFDYAPYSEVFPKAAAIVHSGGIGTTAQALRAGRPMLVLPFAHDQFDNAARVKRLGVSLTIAQRRYNTLHTAAELQRLIGDPPYAAKAAEISKRIQAEDGVAAACDAIETQLTRPHPDPLHHQADRHRA